MALNRKRIEAYLWAAVFSLITGVMSFRSSFEFIDLFFYDAYQSADLRPTDQEIIIIGIDHKSLQQLGSWPWARSVHGALLSRLEQADVKAIGIDIMWAEPNRSNPADDINLARQLHRHKNIVLPVFLEKNTHDGPIIEVLPFSELLNSPGVSLGHVHIEQGADGVTRSVFLKEGLGTAYWPHFSYQLYEKSLKDVEISIPGETQGQSSGSEVSPWLSVRDYHNFIPFNPNTRAFHIVSYIDVLDGTIPIERFREKVVFIGAVASGMSDQLTTPVRLMSGVEVNAHVYQALRDQSMIEPLGKWMVAVINGCVTFLILICLSALTPRQFLSCSALSVVILSILTMLTLGKLHIWWPTASMIISILLFYPVWSWLKIERALSYLKQELADYSHSFDGVHEEEIDSLSSMLRTGYEVGVLIAYTFEKELENGKILQLARDGNVGAQYHPRQLFTWYHEHKRSAIRFNLGVDSECYYIQLTWGEDSKEVKQQFADEMDVRFLSSSTIKRTWANTEVIEATIEELSKEKQLKEQSQHLVSMSLESLQDAVVFTSIYGNVEFLNQKAKDIFECEEPYLGYSILDLFKKIEITVEDTWRHLFKNLILSQEQFQQEGCVRKEFSSEDTIRQIDEKFYLCQGRTVLLDDRMILVFTITDITILKKKEQQQKEMLHFLGHDLRSPLVSILALIERKSAFDQDIDKTTLDEIKSYAEKNLQYAESYLQLAKAEQMETLELNCCDLHAVLDNAYTQVMYQAQEKNIRITDQRVDQEAWVRGYGELLERAVINLLTNAIKYSQPDTEIVLSLDLDVDKWKISVTDQGIGIPENDIPHLFKKYYKSGQNKAATTGVGLGLYFVSIVCGKHQGWIEVQSQEDVGSVFVIWLPSFSDDCSEFYGINPD